MKSLQTTDIVLAARHACKSLSCCKNFFNFEQSTSWRGWENWLTVDIVRRLDHKDVVRFGRYPNNSVNSDILVQSTTPIAIEVKITYIDDKEIATWQRQNSFHLALRIEKDLQKLRKYGKGQTCLMLVGIAFESKNGPLIYKKAISLYLEKKWPEWNAQWRAAGSFYVLSMLRKASAK